MITNKHTRKPTHSLFTAKILKS